MVYSLSLLVPVVGTASSCHAQATGADNQNSQVSEQVIATQPSRQLNASRVEAQKVGQYQYQARAEIARDAIAKIQPHELGGRQAATVYVRNIPVITFLNANPATNTPLGETGNSQAGASSPSKVAGRDRKSQSWKHCQQIQQPRTRSRVAGIKLSSKTQSASPQQHRSQQHYR